MVELSTMPKYEAYKNSGIDWLGYIPSDWNLAPGFTAYSENKRNNKGLKEERVLSLSYGNIIVKPKEKLVGLVPESFETYQIVEPGDLIIRCMDLQNDKTSLRTGLAKDHGIITSAYLNLRINDNFDSKFLYYYLHSLDTTKVLYKFGTGLRQNLSFQDFNRLPIFDISKTLQTSIANFLDIKTAQINEAIAIKEKQIELLKERKQIIIQQAVTRGLNPNAPMKGSGVDWIEEYPNHWSTLKFRFSFKFGKGLNITKENLQDIGIPCVNYGEIHSKFGFELNPVENKLLCVSEEYLKKSPKSLLSQGDFIFADTSEDIDGSGNFTYLNSSEVTFAGYHTVIAKPKINFNSRFVAYFLDSISFRKQVRKRVKGVKVYSITQNILKDTHILLPPRKEQEKIASFLDVEMRKIKDAISIQVNQIEKLKEYKTTLINSAVTGKIKVPELIG